jgi:hypothetical protein
MTPRWRWKLLAASNITYPQQSIWGLILKSVCVPLQNRPHNQPASRNRYILEKLIVAKLTKNHQPPIPRFHWILSFVVMLTRAPLVPVVIIRIETKTSCFSAEAPFQYYPPNYFKAFQLVSFVMTLCILFYHTWRIPAIHIKVCTCKTNSFSFVYFKRYILI